MTLEIWVSGSLGVKAFGSSLCQMWRRGRDSNPRYGFPHTHFPGVRLQPLGHPSTGAQYIQMGQERKRSS